MATIERPVEVDPTFESILDDILSRPSVLIHGKDQHSLVSRIIHEVCHGTSNTSHTNNQDAFVAEINRKQESFLGAVLVHREALLKLIVNCAAIKDAPQHTTPYVGKLTQCLRIVNLMNDTMVKVADRRREGRDEETYDLPTQVMNTFSPAIYELIEYIVESAVVSDNNTNGGLVFSDFEHKEVAGSNIASSIDDITSPNMISDHDLQYYSQYSISQQRTMLLFELLRFFPSCIVNTVDHYLEQDTNNMIFFESFFHSKNLTLRYFNHLIKVILSIAIPRLVKIQAVRLIKFLIDHKFHCFKYYGNDLIELIITAINNTNGVITSNTTTTTTSTTTSPISSDNEPVLDLFCLFKQHPDLIQSGLTSIAKHIQFLINLPLRGAIPNTTSGTIPGTPNSPKHMQHHNSSSPMSTTNSTTSSTGFPIHYRTHSYQQIMIGTSSHGSDYDYGISFILLEYVKYRPKELSQQANELVSKWQTLQHFYSTTHSDSRAKGTNGGHGHHHNGHSRYPARENSTEEHSTIVSEEQILSQTLNNYETIFVKLAEVSPDSMILYCHLFYENINERNIIKLIQCMGYAATGTHPLDAPDRVLPFLIDLLHRYVATTSTSGNMIGNSIAPNNRPLSMATSPLPSSALSNSANTGSGVGSGLTSQQQQQCVTTTLRAIRNFQTLLSSQKLVIDHLPFLRKFTGVDYMQISGIERLANVTLAEGLSSDEMTWLYHAWQDIQLVKIDTYEGLLEVLTFEAPIGEDDGSGIPLPTLTMQIELNKYLDSIMQRLPLPKRMEVNSQHHRHRNSEEWLTIYFTCCITGLEYCLTTKYWRTWLKIGYLLMLCNRMVLDVGLGYPLDMSNDGIQNIKFIYEAFQVEGLDDEFDIFLNDPFIASADLDELITELRRKGFFNKMSYNQWKSIGWFLFQPDLHGREPKDLTQFEAANIEEDENGELIEEEPLPITHSEVFPLTEPDTQRGLVYDILELKQTWNSLVKKRPVDSLPVLVTAETHREPVALCRVFGYGTKQGSFIPTWKRRYFVLENRVFTYFEDEEQYKKDKHVGNPFPITPTQTSIVANNNGDLVIQLNGNNRKLMLKFDNEVDWILWKEGFEEHCSDDAYLRVKRQNIKKPPLFK